MRLDLRVVRAGIRAASAPPGLRVICRLELVPEEFLQQGLHRRVAELAVDPQSPEHLHVAHRKEGARAQIREELSPGDLLLRGTCARERWTLAVPPLLPPNGGGERRVTLFADVQLSADDGRDLENQLRGLVQSHRPQQVK